MSSYPPIAQAADLAGLAPPMETILAFAPGGVVEMSLIAISLEISVLYVTVHHVARILLAVLFAKVAYGWVVKA